MPVEQRAMHQEDEGCIQEQREVNARPVEINEGLEITQARSATLLARMLATGESGRDASPAEPPGSTGSSPMRHRSTTVSTAGRPAPTRSDSV